MTTHLIHREITGPILAAAYAVHGKLGPGLFESVYEECLTLELSRRRLNFERQVHVPVVYDGIMMKQAFRADLIIARKIIVEVKAIEKVLPVHESQLFTYLRLTGLRVGLLINFNTKNLNDGIRRRVL